MSDVSVVRTFLDGFSAGNVEFALAALHDDVQVSEPAGLPTGGEYHGKQAFMGFLQAVAATYEVEIHAHRLFDAGEVTLAMIDTTWTGKATGASIHSTFCEIYTVTAGLITAIDVYPKDTRALYDIAVAAVG